MFIVWSVKKCFIISIYVCVEGGGGGGGWGEGSGVDGRISKEPGAWNSIEIMRRKSVGKQELGKRRKLPTCFDILVLEGALK